MHQAAAVSNMEAGRARFRRVMMALAVFLVFSFSALAVVHSASAGHQAGDGPTITAFSPESASPDTYVWVDGEGFGADDLFSLGGIQIEHDHYSDSRIGFTVPEMQAADYALEIQGESGGHSLCCLTVTAQDTGEDAGDTDEGNTSQDEGQDTAQENDEEDTAQDVGSPPSSDEAPCREAKKNIECEAFGRIEMPAQVDIRGEPVEITAKIDLNTNYADRDARAVMFSIRNITSDGDNPISIALVDFSTSAGEIYTTRIDAQSNEINIWVDVLDLPTGTTIELKVLVGATDRGAYQLETLVMPFDRGYEPLKDANGESISLYSSTLLGVNDETGEVSSGDSGAFFGKIPGFGVAAAMGALAAVAVATSRRRSA